MPNLKEKPTFKDVQEYVKEIERERGFSGQSILQKCLILGEEIGELFKAIRKSERLEIDQKSKITSIKEEIADVIILLSSIANRYDIDIETAFREKEEINKKRNWK